MNTGWKVQFSFSISLHVKDRTILEKIKLYLCVGKIYKHGPQSIQLLASSKEDLLKIINHLDKFPLITSKQVDYEL